MILVIKHLCLLSTLFGALLSPSLWALEIEIKGLFAGGAIVQVDGKPRMLRAGERSPEGVLLVAADIQSATLEIDGERQTLGISRRISTRFTEAEKGTVRIQSGRGGHYFTPGRINGHAVDFIVDTGATAVAMNLPTAQRLGINYRAGQRVSMTTASGVVPAYSVMLDSVRVGAIEVSKVAAIVSMGDFPNEILLGNSYLDKVDMRRESGVLVLEAQF